MDPLPLECRPARRTTEQITTVSVQQWHQHAQKKHSCFLLLVHSVDTAHSMAGLAIQNVQTLAKFAAAVLSNESLMCNA